MAVAAKVSSAYEPEGVNERSLRRRTNGPIRASLRGDRIERMVAGIKVAGTVHYADELQVLVKWDDGKSSSLRVGRDRFWLAVERF